MSNLLIRFRIVLKDYSLPDFQRHNGPLFHRWLPDGVKDAIPLTTKDPSVDLKIWFERFGYKDDNKFIIFDYKRREVEPQIMSQQAILDGGPLFGLLKTDVTSEDLTTLKQSEVGDPKRIAFGKKVVRLIQSPIAQFLNVLRTIYGQYWLPQISEWDSRKESLGAYCNSPLHLEWSFDLGKTWLEFEPEEPMIKLHLRKPPDFREYITKGDWAQLRSIFSEEYKPPLSALLVTRARELLIRGEFRHALIEAVSAIEIAIDHYIKPKVEVSSELTDSLQSFFQLGLPTRVVTIASALGTVPQEDLELSVRAIDARNKVVHEGWNPPESIKGEIEGLLKTIAVLLPEPKLKFPLLYYGNELKTKEEWDMSEE